MAYPLQTTILAKVSVKRLLKKVCQTSLQNSVSVAQECVYSIDCVLRNPRCGRSGLAVAPGRPARPGEIRRAAARQESRALGCNVTHTQ